MCKILEMCQCDTDAYALDPSMRKTFFVRDLNNQNVCTKWDVCMGQKVWKEHKTLPFFFHNIRIYHECEGRREKYIRRIAVWHHKACRILFLAHHCFYLFIHFNISFQKSLNKLRCNFT